MASDSVISGTRLDIYLEFWGVNDRPPPAPAPIRALELGVWQAQLLAAFEGNSQVENGLNSLFQTLFKQGSLDQQFNSLWQQQGQALATSLIKAAVIQQQPNAYQIQPSYPQQGTLTADTTSLLVWPGLYNQLPPGTQGSVLLLDFSLPGISIDLYTTTAFGKVAAPEWNVTFDADFDVAIGVPTDPTIPLVAYAEFTTSNTSTPSPANAAGFLGGLVTAAGNWVSGAITTIGDWFTGQAPDPGQVQPAPGVPDSITPVPLSQLGPLQSLLADLSNALAYAPVVGFTKLGVVVDRHPPADTDPGPTVALTLTHPRDPGPIITNPLAPRSGPSFTSPEIGTSATQVNAGGQVGVSGSYFPAAQANQLTIQWTDTCSGTVLQSEIQWGALPTAPPANGPVPAPPQPADVVKSRNGRFDGQNTFVTPKDLAPSTWYAFQVRDFDVPGFIATEWSAWTAFQTPATNRVDLQLDVTGTSVLVGAGSVGTDGTFSTIATIPTSVPPGTYVLWAVQSGQQMAQTTIAVVAQGQALSPLLQVLNPNTGLAVSGPGVAVGGSAITIRAQHFQPGSMDLHIDSATGTSVGTVTADNTGAVTAPVIWPYGANGSHNLLAVQGSLTATAAVFGEPPAQ